MNDLNFKLTDELWQDLVALEGLPVAAITLWDNSVIDEAMPEGITNENRIFVDIDLFLVNQTKLELYGVMVTQDEDGIPIEGLDAIGNAITQHTQAGAELHEIAADEEEMMVLVIRNEAGDTLIFSVTAWLEDVWETLPAAEA